MIWLLGEEFPDIARYFKFENSIQLDRSTLKKRQRALTVHILRGQLNSIRSEIGSMKWKVQRPSHLPMYSIKRPNTRPPIIKKKFHFNG